MLKLDMLKKKVFIIILVFMVIVSLLGYLVYDVERIWTDQNTWTTGEVFSVTETPNIYIEENGSIKDYYISYCTLTNVILMDDGRVKYECSFLPYYMINVAKSNHKEFAELVPDIIFYRTPEKDPLPLSYLDFTNITEEGLESYGELNIPVELTISIWSESMKESIPNKVSHYFNNLRGRKENQPQKLVSWDMEKVEENLTDEELHDWANDMNYYIEMYLEMDDYDGIEVEPLRELTGYDLMNRLAFELEFMNYYCSYDSVICNREFGANPASNIMLYLYFLNNREDTFVQTFLDTARENVRPFAPEEKLVDKTMICTESPCEDLDYADMQTYLFPVCPVREVLYDKDYSKSNISLFMEEQKEYSETDSGTLLYKKNEIKSKLNALNSIIKEGNPDIDPDIETKTASFDSVVMLDQLCYHVIKYDMKDSDILHLLEKAYLGILNEVYGVIDDSGSINPINHFDDLKTLVARSYMHISDEPFVAHERLAYWHVVGELEERSDYADEKRYIGNMPLTLLLMYLYD